MVGMENGVAGLIVADGERHRLEALKQFFEDNRDAILQEFEVDDFWNESFGSEKIGYLSYRNLAEYWGITPQSLSDYADFHCEGYFEDIKFQQGELHWVEDMKAKLKVPHWPNWNEDVDDPGEGVKLEHDVLTWHDECYGKPCDDLYRLIQQKFPGIKIYAAHDMYTHYVNYCSDTEGRFFPVRYVYYNFDMGIDEEGYGREIWTNIKGFTSLDNLAEYVKRSHGDMIAGEEDIERMAERKKEMENTGRHYTGYSAYRVRLYEIE